MVSFIIQKTLRQIPISKEETLTCRINRDRKLLLKWNALWMIIACALSISISYSELHPVDIITFERIEPPLKNSVLSPNSTLL